MKSLGLKYLVMAEVVVCFAIPVYFLFWGILSLPLWLIGADTASYALIHALCVVGGWLGMIGLVLVVRYLLRTDPPRMHWFAVLTLCAVGLLSIWTEMTGQFSGSPSDWLSFSWFSLLSTIAPTLCTVHLLWLSAQRTRNDARA